MKNIDVLKEIKMMEAVHKEKEHYMKAESFRKWKKLRELRTTLSKK